MPPLFVKVKIVIKTSCFGGFLGKKNNMIYQVILRQHINIEKNMASISVNTDIPYLLKRYHLS